MSEFSETPATNVLIESLNLKEAEQKWLEANNRYGESIATLFDANPYGPNETPISRDDLEKLLDSRLAVLTTTLKLERARGNHDSLDYLAFNQNLARHERALAELRGKRNHSGNLDQVMSEVFSEAREQIEINHTNTLARRPSAFWRFVPDRIPVLQAGARSYERTRITAMANNLKLNQEKRLEMVRTFYTENKSDWNRTSS